MSVPIIPAVMRWTHKKTDKRMTGEVNKCPYAFQGVKTEVNLKVAIVGVTVEAFRRGPTVDGFPRLGVG